LLPRIRVVDFKEFRYILGYDRNLNLHVQTLGDFHCFPSVVTLYFDALKHEPHGGYVRSVLLFETPSQKHASNTVVGPFGRTVPADLADTIITFRDLAATLPNCRLDVYTSLQRWATKHARIFKLSKAEARALKRWPPSLPWHLPSHYSLTLPSRCLLCWTYGFCLGAPDGRPYESTHGMGIIPDPEVEPGVLSDTSAHGRGPERLCVVCWSRPGGCDLCISCSPPSHWLFVEQRRYTGATWNGRHMDEPAWERCEEWLWAREKQAIDDEGYVDWDDALTLLPEMNR
jgi:hypothetical protein